MKKSLLIASLLAVALAQTACKDKINDRVNQEKDYLVTLYNAQGEVIKQWTSNGNVKYSTYGYEFIEKIAVSGTVQIEEVK